MDRNLARGLFLVGIVIMASLLVLMLYQVPQPWRGILICWLLFLSTGGAFILRILRHYAQIRATRASRPTAEPPVRQPTPSKGRPAMSSLRVITSDAVRGEGRFTIR